MNETAQDIGSSRAGSDKTWRIVPTATSVAGQFCALWRYRSFFPLFAIRALFAVYSNAILGIAWMVIRPLMIAGPAIFVVGNVFGISVEPLPLPLFIVVGLASWILFRRGVQWATKSMGRSRAILQRVYAPALLLLIAAMSPALFEFLVVMALVGATAIYYGPIEGIYHLQFGWHMLAVVPSMVMCLLLAVGVGCFTGILNAFARDTWLTLRYVLGFWMLATPVVYPIEIIPEQYRWMMYLNPLAPTVEMFRWGVLGYGTVNWPFVAVAAVEIMILLLLGMWFFAKQQTRLFDHL